MRNNHDADGIVADVCETDDDEDFAAFERLTPEQRQILRDAPYEIAAETCLGRLPDEMRAELSTILRLSVLETYGPDHPQAK